MNLTGLAVKNLRGPASHPCYLIPGSMTAKMAPDSHFADEWPSHR